MVLLYLALASLGQAPPALEIGIPQTAAPLMALGTDDARGATSIAPWAAPFSPPDPSQFTIVVVHGINPCHPFMHLEMAQRYGEAIGATWGRSLNVLGWDWNGNSMDGPFPSRNAVLAQCQGRAMAEALMHAGLAPESLHLVGQSSGCIVVASAARVIADRLGRPVERLTFLDPRSGHHRLVFETLHAGTAGRFVEHFWATGPSGFGSPAPYPNVHDQAVIGPSGWLGYLSPGSLDHMQLVQWHIGQMARNPWSF